MRSLHLFLACIPAFREVLVRISAGSASARILPGILPLQAPLARTKRRNVSVNRAEAPGILSSPGRTRNNKKITSRLS